MSDTPTVSTDPTLTEPARGSHTGRNTAIGIGVAVVVLAAAGITAWRVTRPAAEEEPTGPVVDTTATLAVALRLFPDNLDIRNTAGAALNQTLIDNVYQGLVSADPAGVISPSLAQSWSVSPDAKTYTFTLFPGETFSNGDALTAADVAWSLTEVTAKNYNSYQALANVDTVTATDDTTVVIALTQPDPTLLYNLAGRAGLVLDQDATNDTKSTAVGSGPFVVSEFKAGATLTLARNEGYWGEPAPLAGVVFTLFSDTNAIVNAVNDGSVDVAGIDPNLIPQVSGNADYDLVTGFASDKFTLAFNNQAAPFTDPRVRQAIRYAIDHDAIVEASGGGKTLYGPIVESDPGYEDLSSLYPHDPAKAKQLLTDAGFGGGLALTLTIASFYGTTITDLLTSQLAEVGITLTINAVDFSTWLTDVYTNKDFELSIVDHAEARDLYNWANPAYYFGYDNAEVQRLYAEATTATSDERYASLLRQAARIVSEEAAGDWLYNPTLTTAVRKGVSGVPTDSTSSRLNLTHVTVTAL